MWKHFIEQFGAKNIVPIAQGNANSETDLSPNVIGKVPSVYNTFGRIVGFKDWQKCRVKKSDLSRWEADKRYGFGVILGQPLPNGGVAICIDADTEDANHQRIIADLIARFLNKEAIPQRVRENSNRRAFVLNVISENVITKRVLELPANVNGKKEAVEILANGQQFVAFGVHPSGAEIMWLNGAADDLAAGCCLPDMARHRITGEQLDELITAIAEALPVVKDSTKRTRPGRPSGTQLVKADEVALYLDAKGYTLRIGAEGQRHIISPFADEYTNEQSDGDTSVTYFLPGTHGYEKGHFVSQHASDADRDDGDFLAAIGVIAAQFEDLPAVEGEPEPEQIAAPAFERDKWGQIEATLPNVLAALGKPNWFGYDVRFDQFMGAPAIGGPGKWRPFVDADYVWLRVRLEASGFKPVGRELMRDAVNAKCQVVVIDTAQEWLKGLQWDGVSRCASFFANYFGVAASEYTTACSLYAWSALAGRVLEPGCKADMMPILIGPQGCGKSTGIAAIAPDAAYFAELSFQESEADSARKMRGVLVAEYAEMNGIKTRAIEAIKAHMTRRYDKWVQKYQEHATQYARRGVLFGSSNDDQMFDDSTGARRWLPMECGAVNVAAIVQVRDQLWAEAAQLFKRDGVQFDAAQRLAAPEHERFRVVDDLEVSISEWLDTATELDGTTPLSKGYVTTHEVIHYFGQNAGLRPDRVSQMRVGKALLALNYLRKQRVINNRRVWTYVKVE